MKKYALLIVLLAIKFLFGAEHESIKQQLIVHLGESSDMFLHNMGRIMPARDDAYWQTVLPVLRDYAHKKSDNVLQKILMEIMQKDGVSGA